MSLSCSAQGALDYSNYFIAIPVFPLEVLG